MYIICAHLLMHTHTHTHTLTHTHTYQSQAHNRPEQLRKSNPLDITQYIKTTAAQTNDITVMWHHDILHPQVQYRIGMGTCTSLLVGDSDLCLKYQLCRVIFFCLFSYFILSTTTPLSLSPFLSFSLSSSLSQGFVTTIELADILSSSDLLTKLKSKGIRSADYTRALVKEKLSIDQDSEISATSLKVSLICPVSFVHVCAVLLEKKSLA